jgi:tetratricopeptide (TPR) repeat protein
MKRIFGILLFLLLGAVAFQSFQCSSRELTTAKVAFSHQDYDKAIDFAQQEITKNPENGEAYMLIADSYMMKGNTKLAAEYALKAEKVIGDQNPQLSQRPKLLINKIWVEAYNMGVDNFNKYFSTKNNKFLDSAVNYFEIGKSVRPSMLDFYALSGQAYETRGDSIAALVEYKTYLEKAQKDLDIFKNNNFYIGIPRVDVIKKLGKPELTNGFAGTQGDSLITDLFKVDGKELYVFYKDHKKDLNFELQGLRYDPPANWLPNEQSQWVGFNTAPIAALAQMTYAKQKYEDALTYLKLLGTLEPSNTNANAFLVQVYQDMGQNDKAYSYIQELIKSDPKNKFYLVQLGDLYQLDKKYEPAIESYKKALDIDPTFEPALRNIASAYKNKASIKQNEIKLKLDADKNYKPNFDEYFPDLKESAKYFEEVAKTNKYKNDYKVYSELANIYYVLNDKDKLTDVVSKLETLQDQISKEDLQNYYVEMVKVYSQYVKNSEKLKEYQSKIK